VEKYIAVTVAYLFAKQDRLLVLLFFIGIRKVDLVQVAVFL